uniref:Uncharacterized protein n=1 Tax=Trichogramma kaykai TaxID=54128 RepID=A0ABD2W6Z3_9HYME
MNDETASDASSSDSVVDDALAAAAGQRGIFEKCQSATFHLDGAIYTIAGVKANPIIAGRKSIMTSFQLEHVLAFHKVHLPRITTDKLWEI